MNTSEQPSVAPREKRVARGIYQTAVNPQIAEAFARLKAHMPAATPPTPAAAERREAAGEHAPNGSAKRRVLPFVPRVS